MQITEPLLASTFSPLPEGQWEWSAYTEVLTDKLRRHSPQVEMTVLRHDWEQVNWWERAVLSCLSNTALVRRDILMQSQGEACWFGRTMIPEVTYQRDPIFFNRLNHEPLGKLIFNEPRVVRQRLHSYGIDHRNLEYYWLHKEWRRKCPTLWMRLSFLEFEQSAYFYLAEIFLPGLAQL